MRAPRGFVVVASDHFGPKRWRKTGKRTDYLIQWEREARPAVFNEPDTTGYRLLRRVGGRWMSAGPISPTPDAAWTARRRPHAP